jgi:hypothetical protein
MAATIASKYLDQRINRFCLACMRLLPLNKFLLLRYYSDANPAAGCCGGCYRRARFRVESLKRRTCFRNDCSLNTDNFLSLLVEQSGRCAICNVRPRDPFASLEMDHCHRFGHRRGLLCGRCNRGLGLFDDEPARLRAAAAYLERHGRGTPLQ